MTEAQSYIPGVCNINRQEIASRRKLGHIGLAVFIVLLIIFFAMSLSIYFRVVLFLPAYLSATGYLQARNKFCVGYAAAGQENASEGSTKANDILSADFKNKDQKKARIMNMQAFLIALLLTIIVILI
jgi:accessory gene regulator protein AgrB